MINMKFPLITATALLINFLTLVCSLTLPLLESEPLAEVTPMFNSSSNPLWKNFTEQQIDTPQLKAGAIILLIISVALFIGLMLALQEFIQKYYPGCVFCSENSSSSILLVDNVSRPPMGRDDNHNYIPNNNAPPEVNGEVLSHQ